MHKKATTNPVYKQRTLRNNEWVTVILLGALAKGVLSSVNFYKVAMKLYQKCPGTVERTRQAVNQQ